MGTVNCCVDMSGMNRLCDDPEKPLLNACMRCLVYPSTSAHPTCASNSATRSLAASEGVNLVADAHKAETETSRAELAATPTAPFRAAPDASVYTTDRQSDSGILKHQRIRRQRKNRAARCTQLLPNAGADRLVDAFYRARSQPDNDNDWRTRDSLHRLLRACATFDERNGLDLALAKRGHRLLEMLHGDEDQVFRGMVSSKTMAMNSPRFRRRPLSRVEHFAVATQLIDSAVTA